VESDEKKKKKILQKIVKATTNMMLNSLKRHPSTANLDTTAVNSPSLSLLSQNDLFKTQQTLTNNTNNNNTNQLTSGTLVSPFFVYFICTKTELHCICLSRRNHPNGLSFE
jgi:hypothetical protein